MLFRSGVLAALILLNEVSRRTKAGGILMFFVIPAILTVYFIAIAVGAKTGASWALNNQTYLYMNGWFHYAKLYAALAGCIGFMMIKYEWGIGKAHWFKAYPFAIVAINILIAVALTFSLVRKTGKFSQCFGCRFNVGWSGYRSYHHSPALLAALQRSGNKLRQPDCAAHPGRRRCAHPPL